jgi:hypothetical protein
MMKGKTAAARAELQQSRWPGAEPATQSGHQVGRFVLVFLGRRQKRPPPGEIII